MGVVAGKRSLSAACSVPLAKWTPLSPDVPPAMVSVLLAFSLDDSLFMLSRFMENRRKGLEREENAELLVFETGHTIFVSGILHLGRPRFRGDDDEK